MLVGNDASDVLCSQFTASEPVVQQLTQLAQRINTQTIYWIMLCCCCSWNIVVEALGPSFVIAKSDKVVALYRAEYRTLTQRSRFMFRSENIVLLVN